LRLLDESEIAMIVESLANGWSEEQILKNYPQLTRQDIQAAMEYGSKV
jgi:uncharacterized protein (DUF433 family)